jgi:xanthine dehydrogenase YagR molybdenum-binding subunit
VLEQPLARLEGEEKVTGAARYAFEQQADDLLHAWIVPATRAPSRIRSIDADAALAHPGVERVITHESAPRLTATDDAELLVLQSDRVAYRGQAVALVLAESIEAAREGARLVQVHYEGGPEGGGAPDVELSETHPKLYAPEEVNAGFATDSEIGYPDAALATAEVSIDETYRTPALFNNPMEPHATLAHWTGERLEVVDSSQGTSSVKSNIAALFGLEPSAVRVRAEHVGGGFGSKGSPRPIVPLAVMATLATGRPVKLAYTRQMMFALAGYRTPTISRFRLGADADGKLGVIWHDAFSQTSTIQEFAEQTAEVTRHVYAAPNRRTRHRVAALDVPTPRWMRAPGECPGMYALESAIDELAVASGIDPVELRLRNEPDVDPESGLPFSSRHLVECLRQGSERFGWARRDPRPGVRRDGRWLVGTGVASSIYPAMTQKSGARVTALPSGRIVVEVNATDIGTGARTVMLQIAADALGADPRDLDIRIADSDLPEAPVAGGSAGTASWGWAVSKASDRLRMLLAEGQPVPPEGLAVEVDTEEEVGAMGEKSRFAFGAQFVEVRVDADSGEIVIARMHGVFAAGRILNPRTARSQLLGGMTMGISMALHEHGELDPRFGDYANHDLATYHVAAAADVPAIEAEWLPEHDPHLAPMGGKGIGEIGIVGAAAAITNAIHHATGVRVRDLPAQPDKLLAGMPRRF